MSNKIGKAVVRNKIKRRLRAAYSPYCGHVAPSQMVFMATEEIVGKSFAEISSDMRYLLIRAGLYTDEKKNG